MGTVNIWSLSDDCLGLVSDLVDANDLARLYFCGSKHLCGRLGRAVRSFNLYYQGKRPFRWPLILLRFSALQELKISVPNETNTRIRIKGVDLSSLPPSLQSLKLNISNGLVSLLEKQLHSSIYSKYRPRLSKILLNRFSNLTRLTWRNAYEEEARKWDFSDFVADLSQIRSLTKMTPLSSIKQSWQCSEIANLPSTLQCLSIRRIQLEGTSALAFPPLLTKIQIDLSFTAPSYFFDLVPHTVTSLILASTVKLSNDWQSLSSLSNLTVLQLSCASMDENLTTNLPVGLKYLEVRVHQLWFDVLASLPSDLRGLVVMFIDLRYLPSASKNSLHLSATNSKPEVSAMLPRSLTTMNPKLFSIFPPSAWKNLPRGIAELRTSRFNHIPLDITGSDSAHFAGLPPAFRFICCQELTSSQFVLLPNLSNLTDIVLEFVDHESPKELLSAVSRNCPKLRHLSIDAESFIDSQWFESFEHPLEKLSIGLSLDLAEHPQKDFGLPLLQNLFSPPLSTPPTHCESSLHDANQAASTPPTRRAWYRHLEILQLDEPFIVFIGSPIDWVQSLPSSITHLRLSNGGERMFDQKELAFPSEVLAHLPPNLVSLRIRIFELDSKFFACLPRSLTTVAFHGANGRWKVSDLDFLPKRLDLLGLPSLHGLSFPSSVSDDLTRFCRARPALSVTVGSSLFTIQQDDTTSHNGGLGRLKLKHLYTTH